MVTHEPIRVLVATDCAFWQNRTGAQQRIYTLLKYLTQQSYVVETLYCDKLSQADDESISQHDLRVEAAYDDRPPTNVVASFSWRLKGTIHWLSQKLPRLRSEADQSGGRELEEFRSPEIGRRFQRKLLEFNPQIVIVEYISLAYLLEFVPQPLRKEIVFAIDTHDVMHSRCFQFLQTGHDHWIYVDEDQEREALRGFDLVIAIQEEERAEFQRILPAANVVVAKHAVRCQLTELNKSTKQVTIGYFGSANASNEEAIKSFVQEIWPSVLQATHPSPHLVIAGRVCERISRLEIPNCTIMGTVDDVAEFYKRVEIVVNPVSFGTGLKIKNLEALAFGKCLVTTTAGFAGLPTAAGRAFLVSDSVERFVELLVDLVSQEEYRAEVSAAALDFADRYLSEAVVYQPLISAFEQALCEKMGSKAN